MAIKIPVIDTLGLTGPIAFVYDSTRRLYGATTISSNAINISYSGSTSGLTATNIQTAIDQIVGSAVTASNALTKTGNDIKLGGTQNQHTQIITSSFNFGITGNIGLTGIISLGGTNIIRGIINLLPTSVTSTSQNKTLQLANTTGALSLVNRGMYVRANYSFSTLKQVTILAANGLTPGATNSAQNILPGSTRDWNYYSSVANSSSADGLVFASGVALNNLIGARVLVTLSLTVRSSIDINAMVLGADGLGNLWTNEYGIGVGCPKRVAGVGYPEAVFCPADGLTRLESSYVFDMTSGNAALGNWGDMGIYRNTGITATDGSSATITILECSQTFKQI